MVEFWASAVDTMLQDLLNAFSGGGPEDKAMATARVAQIGHLMWQTFNEGIKPAITSCTDKESAVYMCQNACNKVRAMVQKHIDNMDRDTEASEQEPTTDREPRRLN